MSSEFCLNLVRLMWGRSCGVPSLSLALSLSLFSRSLLSLSLSLSLAPAVTFSIIYTTVNTQMRALQASFPIRKDMLYESVVADEVHDWPSYLR